MGKFITFEGGEGTGKTTQIERAKAYLASKNIEAVVTREPGGTYGAEAIRDLLLKGTHERWNGMTELLLLYAARLDHVEKFIKPALNRGVWVLCDRFADSSMAYQGYARGLGPERVKTLHETVLGNFQPDMTIVLDLDPILAHKRVETRGEELTRFDTESLEFHKVIRDAFLDIAKHNPKRVKVVDAAHSREAIAAQIRELLASQIEAINCG